MKSGRWLTVFGTGYKADFKCPLSTGGAIKSWCTGVTPNWCQAQANIVAESSPLPQPKATKESLRTGYSALKNNTTSTLLFEVSLCNNVT